MISTSENQVVYLGNGINTHFPYSFKILNYDDLHLIRVNKNGNETKVTSDYYIHLDTSIVDYPGYAPGAEEPEVDQPLPLQTGEKLVIYRDVPITQEDDMPEQWPFDVIESALDKSCIIDQQLKGDVDRALKIKRSVPINDFNMEFPVPSDENAYGLRVTSSGFSLTADPGEVYEATKDYATTAATAAEECEEWADHIVYVGEEQPTFEKTYVWVDTDEDDEYQSSLEAQIAAKQDKLIAGQNITIAADGKTISATASVNAYTKAETDTLLGAKADTSTTYTKTEVDGIKSELNADIANRVTIAQGSENVGKYLKVGDDGNVTCDTVSGEYELVATVTLEEETKDIHIDYPFDVKSFCIVIDGANATGSISGSYFPGVKKNDGTSDRMVFGYASLNKYTICNIINQGAYIDCYSVQSSSVTYTNNYKRNIVYNNADLLLPFKGLRMYTTANVPIGTVITVYGVRA